MIITYIETMFCFLRMNYARLLLLSFLFISQTVIADVTYYFKQLSIEQGLSQPMVRCVLNDCNGLIWIGTKSGLNRFDQYELKSYFHEKNKLNSLPNDRINFITEDTVQTIWIGTESGLVTYNRSEDNFSPLMINDQLFPVYSYLFVPDGIVFGGEKSLYKYQYADRSLTEMKLQANLNGGCQFNELYEWINDTYIVGSRYHGLYLYHTNTERLEPLNLCSDKNITSVYVDSHKRIWLSPYNKGVYCYNSTGKQLFHFAKENFKLNNNIILDMLEKGSEMLFATDGGGINVLNERSMVFTCIENHPEDIYSLPVNSINVLYNDLDNNLFAGTIGDGLFGMKQISIKTFRDAPTSSSYGLGHKSVTSLFEDEDSVLWIGTDGGGINSYNYKTNRFKNYPSIAHEKVVSITSYSKDELLLSFFSKGIYIFHKTKHTLTPFTLVNREVDRHECVSGYVVHVANYAKNKFFILAGKIYLYDKEKDTFSTVLAKDEEQERLLKPIVSTDSTSLFLGRSHIAKLNYKTKKLETFIQLDQEIELLTACSDTKKNVWMGTSSGLFMYNASTHKIKKIETNLFKYVSSITSDSSGRLWIGAQNQLFCYIVDENRFVILGESDGVHANQLIHLPAVGDASYLYMGGTSGLLQIKKDISFEEYSQPQMKLIDVILDGLSVIGKVDTKNSNLSIPWDHTSLTIKFIAKGKDAFGKKMYRYSIIGMDKEIVESYSHIINIHSLPQGNYQIMASCSGQNDMWSLPVELLSITVYPPWWKTNWFISLSVVCVLLILALIVRIIVVTKTNKLKLEKKEHEKSVDDKKIRFLINISHELRTPLTLIYIPIKRMLDSTKDESLNKQLLGVYKQAKQMKQIIDMVLDVRKMELGENALCVRYYPFNEWLKTIIADFQHEFINKGIELYYDFDPTIEEIPFDKLKCEIAVSNILMNTLKFSNANTQVVFSTRRSEDGKAARFSVSDQGIGLGDVDMNKLFTRFYQGEHNNNGSGIGLSYVKILIERHGGRVGAINKENENGAIFFFELPLFTQIETTASQPQSYLNELLLSPEMKEPEIEARDLETNTYTLLVVEDESELRDFLKKMLKDYFKHIYIASNGEEALDIIQQYYPDIVVSDVMMPRMDGFELCKKIKNTIEISHIPVVLLTARNDFENTSLGYKLGADAYLSKPFEFDFLMTILRNQLWNRQQIRIKYKQKNIVDFSSEDTFSNADEQFLLNLNELIRTHIENQDLDANFLAKNLGLGRTSFYNKIRILTGVGLTEYINKIRIENAILLLGETSLPISEIAEKVGFAYQTYFSSVFKQLKGVSPTKYRQDLVKRN